MGWWAELVKKEALSTVAVFSHCGPKEASTFLGCTEKGYTNITYR